MQHVYNPNMQHPLRVQGAPSLQSTHHAALCLQISEFQFIHGQCSAETKCWSQCISRAALAYYNSFKQKAFLKGFC
eukprot:1140189-Pelagomonas_calceolata.AAC.1